MFNTKGQEAVEKGGIQKSLQPGVVKAAIYAGEVKTSKNRDKKMLELTLVGPELEDFEGWAVDKNNLEGEKFKGQSSRIQGTSWTEFFNENNTAKNEILNKLTVIASELGLRAEVDAIEANSIEDWAKAAIEILKGREMYWFLRGQEEEYNDKIVTRLSLPKYKFCSQYEDRLEKFDRSNKYHFKALPAKETVSEFKTPVQHFPGA